MYFAFAFTFTFTLKCTLTFRFTFTLAFKCTLTSLFLKDNYFVRPLLSLGEVQYIRDIVD